MSEPGPVLAGPRPTIHLVGHLAPADVADVLLLGERAAAADGVHPLSEHVLLHLRHGGDSRSVHLLAREPGSATLLGYAHLDTTDQVAGPAAEVAVAPDARRRGVGAALLDAIIDLEAPRAGRLRLWAHGQDTAAARLAAARGFRRERRLWRMHRDLADPLEPVALPHGVGLRGFRAGDEDAWLALNAAAFVDLPDQGGWTRADLDRRLAEPWFDPAGFLLAHDEDGQLEGFHWTKVHGAPGHGHPPVGEVYVVGVDPRRRGAGLGRALTLAGLHHLRAAGLGEAMLYVDAGNHAATRLYASLGFTVRDSDSLFRRPSPAGPTAGPPGGGA